MIVIPYHDLADLSHIRTQQPGFGIHLLVFRKKKRLVV